MIRFAVTGGCGFIGSHLVEALLARGHAVVVIDDLSTGYTSNLPPAGGDLDLRIAKAEDFDLTTLGPLAGVFHLAAQASVPLSIENLFESSSTNLRSTLKVIDFCAKASVPLVYASSSAVYGNLEWGSEEGAIELISPYAADKYMSEVYTKVAQSLYGLRSMGLRFFNVYGPRQDPSSPYSGVISVFSSRLIKGDHLTVNGGHQTRDFIYVKDVVDGLIRSHEYLRHHATAGVCNLLTGTSISINELIQTLSAVLGVTPVCQYKPLPPGDPELSAGSVERMQSWLDMAKAHFVGLHEGLKATVDWTRAQKT